MKNLDSNSHWFFSDFNFAFLFTLFALSIIDWEETCFISYYIKFSRFLSLRGWGLSEFTKKGKLTTIFFQIMLNEVLICCKKIIYADKKPDVKQQQIEDCVAVS